MADHGFQSAVFSESTIARHEVVAAISGKRIRVRGLVLTAAGAQTATIESAANSLCPLSLTASFSAILPPTGGGVGEYWFITNPGEALNISLSDAVVCNGAIFWDVI